MASCPKCGKQKVRKRKSDGLRACTHCGTLPGVRRLQRDGLTPIAQPNCEQIEQERAA